MFRRIAIMDLQQRLQTWLIVHDKRT
jgi:hypothetical protein